MEKRKPHNDLTKVKEIVRDPNRRPFTMAASDGGALPGLKDNEMRKVILNLTRKYFHKIHDHLR
jgi:hypothetical protein